MKPTQTWATVDLAEVVEHLREGLQVVGPDFRYLYVNEAAAAHGQRPRDELIGRTMMECYPGIETTELFAHLERIVAEGGAHSLENEFRFPDGRVGWFHLRLARVPMGVVIFSIDITSQKALEAKVRRSQRMDAIGQLAGGVAHDFNNLLTIIQAYGSFIEDAVPEGDPIREDARAVLDAAQRGSDLTHRLLTFARERPVTPQTISVADTVARLGEMLRRTVGEQILLSCHVERDVGDVFMDAGAFDQVLINLVVNARDAVAAGGRIVVEAQAIEIEAGSPVRHGKHLAPGSYVMIAVTDNGTGMTPDQLERVFEPFYTTKADRDGTGLGLATVWGLVEQAGGAVSVYSEPGDGSCFRVYLPRTEKRVAARVPTPPEGLRGRGETVLLVDDQAAVREPMARMLRENGYRVVDASSAAEALLLAEDIGERLAVLVTDVVMPRMSGVELADRLVRRFPSLRVLLVSGFAPRALMQGTGETDRPMLAKPFTPTELLEAVRSVLAEPR